MTPTPRKLLAALDARDGHYCAFNGSDTGRLVPQHRQGGMGGRKGKHNPANVVWLDSIINGLIESDAGLQAQAKLLGIKVSLYADPEQVPVWFARELAWFRLCADGTRTQLGECEANEMRALAGIMPGDGYAY